MWLHFNHSDFTSTMKVSKIQDVNIKVSICKKLTVALNTLSKLTSSSFHILKTLKGSNIF